ncbi:MAG: hypothetical protein HY899_05545 [Deltaproteobacteria bacterium]|nr:hypothetical protein [Deltaproteobacteria bacterium]
MRRPSCGRRWPAPAVALVVLGVIAGAVASSVVTGCSRPLPEEGSAVEKLYVARCSTGCHRPHQPGSMTVEMWRVQLARMEPVIARAGLPPLSTSEKAQIFAYLERNAEGQAQPRK